MKKTRYHNNMPQPARKKQQLQKNTLPQLLSVVASSVVPPPMAFSPSWRLTKPICCCCCCCYGAGGVMG